MYEGLGAVTTAALGLALDAASLRQQAIASNVANAGVKDYVPLRLNFAEQLDQMQAALSAPDGAKLLRAASQQLQLEPVPNGEDQLVQLDVEMASMAQNNVLYQALVKGLNRHLSIQLLAASDGKK